MDFTIGISPCPNDTFIFDALVNKKIDTGNHHFNVVLEDVETLNKWAIEGKLPISKISYGVLPLVLPQYALLSAGGALGKGVGPLLVRKVNTHYPQNINPQSIGLPGKYTTAHLLFSLAYPAATNKKFMVFSAIERALLYNEIDAGVIIHENRFTYQKKGLEKILDLGTYWEEQTKTPVPLGGIVIKRNLDSNLQGSINYYIQQSVAHAFSAYPTLSNYVREHAQEMNETVMRQHIELYVNAYTTDIGADGKHAVLKLLEIYDTINGTNTAIDAIFAVEPLQRES